MNIKFFLAALIMLFGVSQVSADDPVECSESIDLIAAGGDRVGIDVGDVSFSTDEDGNVTTTTAPKQVRKWFYENNGQWYLEIKYGNKILQLAKDKTAIVVEKLDGIISIIEQVKEAVLAKELDNAISAVATRKAK